MPRQRKPINKDWTDRFPLAEKTGTLILEIDEDGPGLRIGDNLIRISIHQVRPWGKKVQVLVEAPARFAIIREEALARP